MKEYLIYSINEYKYLLNNGFNPIIDNNSNSLGLRQKGIKFYFKFEQTKEFKKCLNKYRKHLED